ncbi:hypothetical protein ACSBR1_020791 [Camellia fascicularis]
MAIYDQIAEIAKKVGFEVVKEKDLAKPAAKPWWTRLKMGRFAYWRNHILITDSACFSRDCFERCCGCS